MSAAGEVLGAAGPQEIRAAFTTAIDTATGHTEELTGIAAVLSEAADRYEGLGMSSSTLEHLRDGAAAVGAAATALDTTGEQLQAALADFNNRDGRVGDAVTETGNLMQAEGYTDTVLDLSGAAATTPGPSATTDRKAMTSNEAGTATPTRPGDDPAGGTPATAARRGHHNPDQPRGADGKWIKVGDVLGFADGENVHGTDRVTGTDEVSTDLALVDYPDDGVNMVGAFVEVTTQDSDYDGLNRKRSNGDFYESATLGPDEADTAADRLEELAGMVESGYRPPEPTLHTRARQRLELLLQEDKAVRRQRIGVGDDDNFPLTTAQLLKLLVEADPTLSAPQTRTSVVARAGLEAGGEPGIVWFDMEPDATGQMQITVTSLEGTESPDDEDRQPTARHTPDGARELAGKLRAFARAARQRDAARTPSSRRRSR
jgi:hypothetical protein